MDEYIERLKRGTLKLYALDDELPPDDAIAVRRRFVENQMEAELTRLGEYTMNAERAVKKNCENMVGCIQIPVGVAGPVPVQGEYANGEFYLPLATTEGALVASVNRGCRAITEAGGATVRIQRDGMTRAPVFAARDVSHAMDVVRYVETHEDLLRDLAEATTSFGKLTGIRCFVTGTSVFVRLEFFTADAMGMNMVTIGSERVAQKIEQETGATLVSLSGNMCTDKKPSALNLIEGRGKTVIAGVYLTNEQVQRIFKCDAKSMTDVNTRKNLVGSARAGALGFNAHAANVIAAMYLACGQDPAHVVEGSSCITTIEETEGGVYVAVTLPAVQVGTVGGGTGLDTQRELLTLLGCAGGGTPPGSNARKFAEIVATGVLAGELSLIGAQAAGHLARAHQQLGR